MSKRISGKLNLMNLHVIRKMITGAAGPVECIVIPIQKNKLFVGEKGVYLDLIAFERKERKSDEDDTHIIRQSFSKKQRENMSEEELKNLPILGGIKVWNESYEADSVNSMETQNEEDPLPF